MSRRAEGEAPGASGPLPAATYLMTAGLSSDDYRFLGRAPKDPFWRRYAEYTSFERPTAILQVRGDTFRLYLSGILSARRDRTKTPLRYTLVLEGPTRSQAGSTALRALAAFVCDLAEIHPGPMVVEAFGRALDTAFPEPFVESALATMRGAQPASAREGGKSADPLSEIEDRVAQAMDMLPRSAPFQETPARFFSGGRASINARSQFLGFAARLLEDGEPGSALALNLASRDHLEPLGAGEQACAVLFAGETGEEALSEPIEAPPKKGFPGSPKGLLLRREAQAEPGWSIPRLGHLLWGALRTVRDWLMGTRERS